MFIFSFFKKHGTGPGPILKTITLLIAFLIVLPAFIIIPASFNAGTSFQFPPQEWSLRWYHSFFTSRAWVQSLFRSLQIASIVAVLSTILGVSAAIGLKNVTRRIHSYLFLFYTAPIAAPSIVIALAVYSVFLKWQLAGTQTGLVLAHTMLSIPFVVTTVAASLANYDARLELASSSLGAPPWRTFVQIKMPLIAPGVIAGFLFAFVNSFDEFTVALFLQTPSMRTLPVQMYNSIILDLDPTISAASSVIIVTTTAVFLLFSLKTQNKNI